jgi:hypothetical protein
MTNEIVVHQQAAIRLPQEWEFGAMERLANYAAQSGLTSLKPAQAIFIILKGYELNISPMQALADIHLVNGKPGLSVQLMISLANRSGMLSHFDIPDADEANKTGRATVSATRKDRPDSPITMTFTVDDAKKAGLWDKTGPWKQYPGQMLVNRAVSMLLRRIIPEALSGMYLAEELENTEHNEPSITISETLRELPAPVVVSASPYLSETDETRWPAFLKWAHDKFEYTPDDVRAILAHCRSNGSGEWLISGPRDTLMANLLAEACDYDGERITAKAVELKISEDIERIALSLKIEIPF